MNDDYQYQDDTSGRQQPFTPRRQAPQDARSDSEYQTECRQPREDPLRPSRDEDQPHLSSHRGHDTIAEVCLV